MRIVVLFKVVPDTYGERRLNLSTGLLDRESSDPIADEVSERALEVALTYGDTHPDTDVLLLTMAPESASAAVRHGLAMGATRAVHVVDDRLAAADAATTAEVLAGAIRSARADLVIAGNVSTDGAGGVVPAMVAEYLGIAHATALASVEITETSVTGVRATEVGNAVVSAPLPAVISITEQLPDARFPGVRNVMAARRKPYEVIDVTQVGVDPDDDRRARSIVVGVAERPARTAGVTINDDGTGGRKIADFLIDNGLV